MTFLTEKDVAGLTEKDAAGWADSGLSEYIGELAEPLARLQPDARPTLLVVGDAKGGDASDDVGRSAIARWAERAGLRCVGQVPPEEAAERLARTVGLNLVLLDLRGMDVAARIGRTTAQALTGRYGLPQARLAVITDLAGLDCALALLDAPEAEFLCEPPDSDIITLLVMAGLRPASLPGMPLHDAARDTDTARLERLSDEVRRLAVTIERMAQHGAPPLATAGAVMDPRSSYRAGSPETAPDPARQFKPRERSKAEDADGKPALTQAEVRALIRARRMREQHLPADLFADPAWDMMLDLLAAKLAGQRVSVSSLCIAAAVPPTTALRWIRQLTDRSVFARIDDPADGRRVFIELTEAAMQAVLAWAHAVRRNGGLLAGVPR